MKNYDNITIEKGMYQSKEKSLTDVLESLDPSENYVGTSLEGLDAFSRQLKRFDIKVSGARSDCVEKFFQTSNSAALFPEYVVRAVKQGMEHSDIIPDIVASVTSIDGMDYRSIASNESESSKKDNGLNLPKTEVKTKESLVKLHKRGRMLMSSYESLRFQRLDLFTVTLNQIGAYISRAQTKDAIDVLIYGDSNDNVSQTIHLKNSNIGITYDDLLEVWAALSPYKLNTILAPTEAMRAVLRISEIVDVVNSHSRDKMFTPLGANLLHIPSINEKFLVGLDNTCALEMVKAGDVTVDYDKLIDRQFESATISCIAGFAKIFNGATKVLYYGGKDR